MQFVGLDALQIPVVSCQWSVVRMTQRQANPFAGHWPLVTGHLLSDKLKFEIILFKPSLLCYNEYINRREVEYGC